MRHDACRRHLLCGHVLHNSVDFLCRVSLQAWSDSPHFQQDEISPTRVSESLGGRDSSRFTTWFRIRSAGTSWVGRGA